MASRAALELYVEMRGRAAQQFKELGDTAHDTAARLESVEKGTGGVSRAFGALGSGLAGGFGIGAGIKLFDQLGDAAAGAISAGIEGAATLQGNLNLLGATSGATAKELDAISAKATALGSDLSLPGTSAGDAAAAMLELSKAGLSVADTMGAAKGVLQLSAAGNLENAKAAEIAANALNAFGLSGDKAILVADQFAATANASSSDVTDLADGFSMAAAIFNSFQSPAVGAEQAMTSLNAAMGILANNGIKGSDAGTSLKQSLLQLAAPSDKAKGLMKDLAERVGETGDLAYDASGRMRSYRDIIDITARATAGMTQAERDYTIATIFGADATRAILALVKDGPAGFDKMSAAVSKSGAAGDLAAANMKGYHGALEGLTSTFDTLATSAGQRALPALEAVVRGGTELLAAYGPALIDSLATVFNFLGDQATPILSGLGAATITYAIVQLPAMITAVGTATTALIGMAGATTAALGPFALVGLAVGGLIAAHQAYRKEVDALVERVNAQSAAYQQVAKAQEAFANRTTLATPDEIAANEAINGLLERRANFIASLSRVEGQNDASSTAMRQRLQAGLVEVEGQLRTHAATLQQVGLHQQAYNTWLNDSATAGAAATAAGAIYTESIKLTAEQIEKLNDDIAKIAETGTATLGQVIATDAGYLATLESNRAAHEARMVELRKKGDADAIAAEQAAYAQSAQQQAVAFANEQAAQLAHLGTLLINHIEAYAQMNGIGAERTAQLTAAIANEYGIQASLSQQGFAQMTAAAETWLQSTSSSTQGVIGQFEQVRLSAADTEAKQTAMVNTMVADLVRMRDEGQITTAEYIVALGKIPAEVKSKITLDGVQEAKVLAAQTGSDIATGVAQGIYQDIAASEAALQELVYRTIRSGRRAAQAASPSKLSNSELGQPIGQGVGIGIVESSSVAETAMRDLIVGTFTTGALQVPNQTYQLVTALSTALYGAFTATTPTTTNALQQMIVGSFMGATPPAQTAARSFGDEVVNELSGTIQSATSTVADALAQATRGGTQSAGSTVTDAMRQLGEQATNELAGTIRSAESTVASAMQQMTGAAVASAEPGGKAAGAAVGDQIIGGMESSIIDGAIRVANASAAAAIGAYQAAMNSIPSDWGFGGPNIPNMPGFPKPGGSGGGAIPGVPGSKPRNGGASGSGGFGGTGNGTGQRNGGGSSGGGGGGGGGSSSSNAPTIWDQLSRMGQVFGTLAQTVIARLEQSLAPLKTRADALKEARDAFDKALQSITDERQDVIDRFLSLNTTDLTAIARYQEDLLRLDTEQARVLGAQQRTKAEELVIQKQIEEHQKKALALQEAQQNLQFLQQQQDLLSLIKDYKLDPATILNGMELGMNADLGKLLDALMRATNEVVKQTDTVIRGGTPTLPGTPPPVFGYTPGPPKAPNMGFVADRSSTSVAQGGLTIYIDARGAYDERKVEDAGYRGAQRALDEAGYTAAARKRWKGR